MKKENIPNALTLIRIVFIPIFILMLIFGKGYGWHVAAAIVFAVASITDYLDGYLARKWKVVSNFGKFADPMAVIICRELAVTGLRLLLVETGGVVLPAAMPGKIKTFSQMFAIIFLLFHWDFMGQITLYVALIFTVYSGYEYFKGSAYLFKDTFR